MPAAHALDLDDASAVLPPPRPDDLWRPESAAGPEPVRGSRCKSVVGVGALLIVAVAVCGLAGSQLLTVFGLGPPSPPRHVLTDPRSSVGRLLDPTAPRAAVKVVPGGGTGPAGPARPGLRSSAAPRPVVGPGPGPVTGPRPVSGPRPGPGPVVSPRPVTRPSATSPRP